MRLQIKKKVVPLHADYYQGVLKSPSEERVNSPHHWPERTVRESLREREKNLGRNKKQTLDKEWIL